MANPQCTAIFTGAVGGVGPGSLINLKRNAKIETDAVAGEALNAGTLTVEGSGGSVAKCDGGTCSKSPTGQTVTARDK